MKRSITACLALCFLFLSIIGTASAEQSKYSDIPVDHWAYPAIQTLSAAGIVHGYPDGSFRPELTVTREQFAVVLVRTLKIPLDEKAPQIFSDVTPNHRYFLYIDAAKSFIPTPSNPLGKYNFNGDRIITREEVAEAFALALNLNRGQKTEENYLSSRFKDYKNISPEYRENAARVVNYGILAGDSKGNFNAKAGLRRAELTVALDNILRKKSAVEESFKPPHKPWTIELLNFTRPDNDLVQQCPNYNELQRFCGTVISKVCGFNNSHLTVEAKSIINYNGMADSIKTKTVNVYVYEQQLDLFSVGDLISFDYDRNNNVKSYVFERRNKPD